MAVIDDGKKVFAKNLNYYLNLNKKSQKEVAEELSISISTFGSWCTAKKMPRMDKIQLLADYFGIKKSDLIENKSETPTTTSEGLSETEKYILKYFRSLNKEDAIKFILDLQKIGDSE